MSVVDEFDKLGFDELDELDDLMNLFGVAMKTMERPK